MLRIRKDDRVIVVAGKDRGKSGKVIKVLPDRQRAVVEGINIVKKARRRTRQEEQGGLIEIETPIHISNIMLVDKKGNKRTRFGVSILKDGSHVRISKQSGEAI